MTEHNGVRERPPSLTQLHDQILRTCAAHDKHTSVQYLQDLVLSACCLTDLSSFLSPY